MIKLLKFWNIQNYFNCIIMIMKLVLKKGSSFHLDRIVEISEVISSGLQNFFDET